MSINTTTAPVTAGLSQEKALEILNGLIANPNTPAAEIPQILQNIIATMNNAFAPVVAPIVIKKRKRRASLSPNLGWPAGVSRAEYQTWKAAQVEAGVTENLNPQQYKRERDAAEAAPVVTVAATPAPAPTGTKKQAKDAGLDNGKEAPKGKPASAAALAAHGINTSPVAATSGRRSSKK